MLLKKWEQGALGERLYIGGGASTYLFSWKPAKPNANECLRFIWGPITRIKGFLCPWMKPWSLPEAPFLFCLDLPVTRYSFVLVSITATRLNLKMEQQARKKRNVIKKSWWSHKIKFLSGCSPILYSDSNYRDRCRVNIHLETNTKSWPALTKK